MMAAARLPKASEMNSSLQSTTSPTRSETRKPGSTYLGRENLRINIIYLHGEETYQRTKRYEKLRTKKATLLCDLIFLQRCRDADIIPKFCKLSYHKKSPKIKNILRRASQALVRDSIHNTRKELNTVDAELKALHLRLSYDIHPILWQTIDTLATFKAESTTTEKTQRQKRKYEQLHNQQGRTTNNTDSHTEATTTLVYNISDQNLDENAISVLKKGFNFAVAPNYIPKEDIICRIESAIRTLDANTAEVIRQETTHILRKARPPKKNLTIAELTALRHLRNNKEIIILPADKGNATVVMNTAEYKNKIHELLQDETYKKIPTDPTTYLEKTTKTKIKASPIDAETQTRIIPREKSSKCPKMYGIPKIHKPEVPLRPIVSSIGSPLQELARYLAKTLQVYTENIASHVKNSAHFIEIIKNETLTADDILVSFDVTSLFTNIPTQEAISIIENKYKPAKHIIELIKHCISNTYFVYEGQRYRQTQGAPMGSPLSPILATLFMEELETQALQSTDYKPKLWVRYVDDTFVIWPHGEAKLNNFLHHLNNIHNKIKFTMEKEENGTLPFLDVLTIKKPDGTLGHTVYRKQTHTNRYLHANSHHHPAQLNGVIRTLTIRSQNLTDKEHLREEQIKLKNALKQNGYTDSQIKKATRRKSNNKKTEPNNEDNKIKIPLPYIKGTTDRLSTALQKHNIGTIFTTEKKIKQTLQNPKEKIELEGQGVYEIPCSCGLTYVGQSNRRISARREEHKVAMTRKDTTSALFTHKLETGHPINFDGTKTIANIEHFHSRIIREAIEIEKRPNNLNKRNDALRLPNTWRTLLTDKKHTNNAIGPNARATTPTTTNTQQEHNQEDINTAHRRVTRSITRRITERTPPDDGSSEIAES